jgi:Flp pilus assembly protein TadG
MSEQTLFPKSSMWRAIRRFIAGKEAGSAMVEFTIFAPALLAMAIYTMDYGLLSFNRMEVQNAAQAGAQYAVANNTYDPVAISTAVTSATKFTAVTAASSQFCGCPTATSITFCSATCASCSIGTCATSVQGLYVSVTATPATPYKPFIKYGLVSSSSYNISAQSTARLR